MTIGCFAGFIIDYEKMFLVGTSLVFAILMLLALRKTQSTKYRIGLIYAHLSFLFFPFTLFTTEFSCAAVCAPCGGTDLLGLALLSLPTTLAFCTVAGFVLIPTFYVLTFYVDPPTSHVCPRHSTRRSRTNARMISMLT